MEYRVFCLAMAFVGKKQQTVDANIYPVSVLLVDNITEKPVETAQL